MTGLHGIHVLVGIGLISWITYYAGGTLTRALLLPGLVFGLAGYAFFLTFMPTLAAAESTLLGMRATGWLLTIATVLTLAAVGWAVLNYLRRRRDIKGKLRPRVLHPRRHRRPLLAPRRPDLDLPVPAAVPDPLGIGVRESGFRLRTSDAAAIVDLVARPDQDPNPDPRSPNPSPMSHQTTHSEHHQADHGHDDAHHPHAVPLGLLIGVFAVLLFFTFITVAVTEFDFGYRMNLLVAMVVALIKAVLVGLYFMHLRWDAPLNGFILVASLLFVTLFIVATLTDSEAYQPTQEAAAMSRPAQTSP